MSEPALSDDSDNGLVILVVIVSIFILMAVMFTYSPETYRPDESDDNDVELASLITTIK